MSSFKLVHSSHKKNLDEIESMLSLKLLFHFISQYINMKQKKHHASELTKQKTTTQEAK